MTTTHLRSVDGAVDDLADGLADDVDPGERIHEQAGGKLPDFEGEEVETARFKLTSTSNLEAPDAPVRIDEIVRLYVEGRVTRVDHVVDKDSGKLKRVQTVTVSECIQLPWDFDTGAFE